MTRWESGYRRWGALLALAAVLALLLLLQMEVARAKFIRIDDGAPHVDLGQACHTNVQFGMAFVGEDLYATLWDSEVLYVQAKVTISARVRGKETTVKSEVFAIDRIEPVTIWVTENIPAEYTYVYAQTDFEDCNDPFGDPQNCEDVREGFPPLNGNIWIDWEEFLPAGTPLTLTLAPYDPLPGDWQSTPFTTTVSLCQVGGGPPEFFVYLPLVSRNYASDQGGGNQPPNSPSGPSPAQGASYPGVNVDLTWTGGDPDGDAVTYDVYLEAEDKTPDVLACSNVSAPSCQQLALQDKTHYYWRVLARDAHGKTILGPVWEFAANFSHAWQEIGAGSASGGGVSNNVGWSYSPSLAIGPDGGPYVAWQASDGGDYEIYVLRWNGSLWQEVGAGSASGGGISNNSEGSYWPSLAIDSGGTPYVAWEDYSSGNNEIYVRRWDGNAWAEVGVGSASGGGISNSGWGSSNPKMAISPSGTPYVTWSDSSSGNNEIYVRQWDGSAWTEIGIGSASGGGISNNDSASLSPSIAFDQYDSPLIVWLDHTTGGDWEIYVRQWWGETLGWMELGTGSATGGGISNNYGDSFTPSAATSPGGTPHVVWADDSGGDVEIYLRRWNGIAWVEVGTGSASGGGISSNSSWSGFPSMSFAENGLPYVAWSDDSGGNYEIYVRRWNGTLWEEVGPGSGSAGGISENSGFSGYPALSITQDGVPYVVWEDDSSGNEEIYALRYATNPPSVGLPIDEGFEGGLVPPSGWTQVQTNPRDTWKIDPISAPYAGSYSADCEHDDQLAQQNEVLLSPEFQASSAQLQFYSFGSLYWCRDTYDNCDLNVWLVVGEWGGLDDVLLRTADDDWTDTWAWSLSSIDLTPHLPPGTPVRIAFQYEGQDGAQGGLDAVRVTQGGALGAGGTIPAPGPNGWSQSRSRVWEEDTGE